MVRPDAVFIQSESTEHFHQSCTSDEAGAIVSFENERRFLALDALYARPLRGDMLRYVRQHGVTDEELDRFMNNRLGERCVMGTDYYVTNEHMVMSDLSIRPADDLFGWYLVTHEYYQRYGRPVMHTETNPLHSRTEPTAWLWKQWHNVRHMRRAGTPVVGFTWYSLTDQVDWDTALREDNGRVNEVGLFDLDRSIRPAGREYKELVHAFGSIPLVPNGPYFALAGCP